jgi:hypothetical protein
MKRSHRHWHALAWWLVTVSTSALLVLALLARPASPANDMLPAVLVPMGDGG